jgi:hypothetical protein
LEHLLTADARRELWESLNLAVLRFADLSLDPRSADVVVWERCQSEQLLLLTDNRNADKVDSLELAIRDSATPSSLPVFTIGDSQRFLHDRAYAERLADKFLQDLFDIENYRGVGRVYIP